MTSNRIPDLQRPKVDKNTDRSVSLAKHILPLRPLDLTALGLLLFSLALSTLPKRLTCLVITQSSFAFPLKKYRRNFKAIHTHIK